MVTSHTDRPTVAVISLGGTISCTPADGSEGVAPTLGADDLLQVYGLTDAPCEVQPVTWSTRDSSEITFDELVALAGRIRELYENGIDGVVLTQGTDTIDETAFALDLLLGSECPIVVTGAMRDASRSGADGAANLHAALLAAPSAFMRELGTVVVINDEIHLARWVRKTHTANPAAFESPATGPVGWIVEGRVSVPLRPRLLPTEPILAGTAPRPVALIPSVMDGDPALFSALPDLGFAGLVVDGMGGGHVDGATAEELGKLARLFPVVYASRTGRGNVLRSTYDSPGAELDLQERGVIPAGTLDGMKARILLALLLKAGSDVATIRAHFEERDLR